MALSNPFVSGAIGLVVGASFGYAALEPDPIVLKNAVAKEIGLRGKVAQFNQKQLSSRRQKGYGDYISLIGNTPLIELKSLSKATGRKILVKCEQNNPSGSLKDRIAKSIIEYGESTGKLTPDKIVVEATAGSTGIALAAVCRQKGYKLKLFLPTLVSDEKISMLKSLGADVTVVPIVPSNDPDNFIHQAHRAYLAEPDKYYYCDQFNTPANYFAHYNHTGPEIWQQTGGNIDGFVMSAGTGGTIAGISRFLTERKNDIKIALADPPGSGLYNLVRYGTLYDDQDTMLVQPLEPRSIYEGIGIARQTENIVRANVHTAYEVSDKEGVDMAYYLLRNEGLHVGGSSALNIVGAVHLARSLPPDSTVVTIICDGGHRYASKMYNTQWQIENDLVPYDGDDLLFINPTEEEIAELIEE